MNSIAISKLFEDWFAGPRWNALYSSELNSSYPPSNIIKNDDDNITLEFAVAGFSKENLTVDRGDNYLSICGKTEQKDKNYVHKGIGFREFRKTFELSKEWEVLDPKLNDGILEIQLKRMKPPEPETKRLRIR